MRRFPLLTLLGFAVTTVVPALADQPQSDRQSAEIGGPAGRLPLSLSSNTGSDYPAGALAGVSVVLGDGSKIGTVETVVIGSDRQPGLIVALDERFRGRRVILPVSGMLIRNGRLIAAYTLDQLRALPSLDAAGSTDLAPVDTDFTISVRPQIGRSGPGN
ncbi:PRC-barrel domain-containing protein [Microvirga roseola]|uniref:PRC-barrel domain-containing protein n=1 Tax=Microvirga roseola TaxID=2883126 RepID=UPI001E608800|nr:PRC-barrel domain-containing protein [Microvirga roseola]